MDTKLVLMISMPLALLTWGFLARWCLLPWLQRVTPEIGLRPLILVHGFRYIGLMFLIPGVTHEVLDPRFAEPAAYGDLAAAVLAFVALASLKWSPSVWRPTVWVFNVFGLIDLLYAVTQGLRFTANGALGAAFWIPMILVPMLLVSHAFIAVVMLNGKRGRVDVLK